MTTEALIGKLSSLRAREAELSSLKQFSEDGRQFDREIAVVQQDIQQWYKVNTMNLQPREAENTLSISSHDGGKTFTLMACRFPSPGVMRTIDMNFTREDVEKMIGFFGGVQVEYVGAQLDAVAAFTSIERRFRNATEEIGKLRRKVRELEETLTIKEQELSLRYDDANQ